MYDKCLHGHYSISIFVGIFDFTFGPSAFGLIAFGLTAFGKLLLENCVWKTAFGFLLLDNCVTPLGRGMRQSKKTILVVASYKVAYNTISVFSDFNYT